VTTHTLESTHRKAPFIESKCSLFSHPIYSIQSVLFSFLSLHYTISSLFSSFLHPSLYIFTLPSFPPSYFLPSHPLLLFQSLYLSTASSSIHISYTPTHTHSHTHTLYLLHNMCTFSIRCVHLELSLCMRQFKTRHLISISFLHFFLSKLFQCRLYVSFFLLVLAFFSSIHSAPLSFTSPIRSSSSLFDFNWLLAFHIYTTQPCTILSISPSPLFPTYTYTYTYTKDTHRTHILDTPIIKYSTIQHSTIE
jgi:hypothetical protein